MLFEFLRKFFGAEGVVIEFRGIWIVFVVELCGGLGRESGFRDSGLFWLDVVFWWGLVLSRVFEIKDRNKSD